MCVPAERSCSLFQVWVCWHRCPIAPAPWPTALCHSRSWYGCSLCSCSDFVFRSSLFTAGGKQMMKVLLKSRFLIISSVVSNSGKKNMYSEIRKENGLKLFFLFYACFITFWNINYEVNWCNMWHCIYVIILYPDVLKKSVYWILGQCWMLEWVLWLFIYLNIMKLFILVCWLSDVANYCCLFQYCKISSHYRQKSAAN